jgi:hypothetical protein
MYLSASHAQLASDFLLDSSAASIFTKFVRDNIDPDHARPLRLSG